MQCACVICQDRFDTTAGIVAAKCGHVFHINCIHEWITRSNTCPECRSTVCKKNLTKLFFHITFDGPSDINIARSLDAYQEYLREKDSIIREKDARIRKLEEKHQDTIRLCGVAANTLHETEQKLMNLQHRYSNLQNDLKRFNRVEAKNLKLIEEINILKGELEHLNNVKTIVEVCSNDAKQIMKDMQAQVTSEDGKVATNRIAIYCSVIKRELCRLKEEKTQLQKEVTQLQCRMGLLRAENDKKIRLLEERIQKLKDIDSSSIYESPDPVSITSSILKTGYAGCCNKNSASVGNKSFTVSPGEKYGSPITVDFAEAKRPKMKVVILDKECPKVHLKAPETPASRLAQSVLPSTSKFQNGESVSRVGYNGLGGHGRFIMGSGKRKI